MANKDGFNVQINQSLKDGMLLNVYGNDVKEVVKNFNELKNQLGLDVEKDANEVVKEAGLEPEEESNKCPQCNSELSYREAGISKRTNKPYTAFYSCSNPKCEFTKDA